MSAMKYLVLLFVALAIYKPVKAASASAKCLQTVISQIAIFKVSDLNFGESVQGDAAKTIAPDTVENQSNASFIIQGEKNKSFQILLPADNTVRMVQVTNLNGGAKLPIVDGIPVNSFTTNSKVDLLDSQGQKTIFVGATRSQLLPLQNIGSYEGSFTVDVIY